MALYVIVRHEYAPQRYDNKWDGDKLLAIHTLPKLARECEAEKEKDKPIFVHRTGSDYGPRRIVCSAHVSKVECDDKKAYVEFTKHLQMDETPPVEARQGEIFYRYP